MLARNRARSDQLRPSRLFPSRPSPPMQGAAGCPLQERCRDVDVKQGLGDGRASEPRRRAGCPPEPRVEMSNLIDFRTVSPLSSRTEPNRTARERERAKANRAESSHSLVPSEIGLTVREPAARLRQKGPRGNGVALERRRVARTTRLPTFAPRTKRICHHAGQLPNRKAVAFPAP